MTKPSAIASHFFIVKNFSLYSPEAMLGGVELPAEALDYHAWQPPPDQNGTRFKMDLLCLPPITENSVPPLDAGTLSV